MFSCPDRADPATLLPPACRPQPRQQLTARALCPSRTPDPSPRARETQHPRFGIYSHPRYKPQARVLSPPGLGLCWQGPSRGAGPWLLGGCGWADEESFDAEGAPVSCPWFYPVVEQHDVTYHRVKPLAGHRERDTGRSHTRSPPSRAWREVTTGERAVRPRGPMQKATPAANRGAEPRNPTPSEDIPAPGEVSRPRAHRHRDAPPLCQGPSASLSQAASAQRAWGLCGAQAAAKQHCGNVRRLQARDMQLRSQRGPVSASVTRLIPQARPSGRLTAPALVPQEEVKPGVRG